MDFNIFLEKIAPKIVRQNRFDGDTAKTMIAQLDDISRLGLRSTQQVIVILSEINKLSHHTKEKIIAELIEIRERERDI